jgi:hypothetical protein
MKHYFSPKVMMMAAAVILLKINISSADSISDLLGLVSSINNADTAMAGYEQTISGLEGDIKNGIGSLNSAMTSHTGMGSLNFKDFASWGNGSSDWGSVLNLAQSGGGAGNLGAAMSQLAKQFPMNTNFVNQHTNDPVQQQWYAVNAQTALAARAASQADYNQIQQQINNEQQLKDQIATTPDIKAAADLQNRLQVENNLIQLEMLRELSLSNQQQALKTQAAASGALQDAEILSH